jgi:hypothetical protein
MAIMTVSNIVDLSSNLSAPVLTFKFRSRRVRLIGMAPVSKTDGLSSAHASSNPAPSARKVRDEG